MRQVLTGRNMQEKRSERSRLSRPQYCIWPDNGSVWNKTKFNLNKLNFAAYWIPLLFTIFCVKGKAIPIEA
jgi:hypothetical protein